MHSLRPFLPAAIFFCCLAPALDAAAESVKALQWEINADKLTRLENPARITAEGHVELTKIEKTTGAKPAEATTERGWNDLLGDDAGEAGADSKAERRPSGEDAGTHSKAMPMISGNAAAAPETVTVSKVMSTIKADRMIYDPNSGTVQVNGKVLIEIGTDQLAADSGMVNLKQETGQFENAVIIRQEKDLHFEGKKIEKTGELTYRIEDGWIITCKLKDGEVPPWSFKSAETEITDGGYAYLKHATFRIKDVPVLYTPIMVLPAKRNRQTGFLFPLVSISDRNGFGMELPFFINISPSSDITLYPHYIANRGFMAGAEGRYALDKGDKGTLMANFLSDDMEAEGRYTYTSQERWWLRGKADQRLGEWTARLDLDLISDQDYLSEFDAGRTGLRFNDSYYLDQFGRGLQDKTVDHRTNSLRTLRSWDNGMSLQASLMGIDDLAEKENGSTALWKLPEIKHNGRLNIYDEIKTDLRWNTDYVHYWRETGVGAQRIDLYPKVITAVPLFEQRMETSFTAGIRDTLYSINGNGDETWEDSGTKNRILGSFESELSTMLRKDFGEIGDGWSHVLRPFLKHTYVTDDDKELPEFDEVDTFGDQNKITYGLNNFFTLSGLRRNGEEFERDYGYVKLQQSYELRSDVDEEPFLPVELRTAWYPTNSLTFRYETDLSVYDDGFLRHFAEGDYQSGRGDIFSLDYLYNKNTDGGSDTSSVRLSALVNLMYDFSAGYSLEKSLEDSITVQEKMRLIYHPACWSVELGAETTPDNEQITIMFQLANIGSPFGLDF